MTKQQLRHRGTRICRRLAEDVTQIAPEGVGHWDRAWDIVAPVDAEFMIALSAWESDPTDASNARVKVAYEAVLDAWRQAAAEFEGLAA